MSCYTMKCLKRQVVPVFLEAIESNVYRIAGEYNNNLPDIRINGRSYADYPLGNIMISVRDYSDLGYYVLGFSIPKSEEYVNDTDMFRSEDTYSIITEEIRYKIKIVEGYDFIPSLFFIVRTLIKGIKMAKDL